MRKITQILLVGVVLSLLVVAAPPLKSQTSFDTIPVGSYIINMGITPQTIGNGLKPYGLIHELLETYNVPVMWIIDSTKLKDSIDFIHDGIEYKGGPFIVSAAYIDTVIDSVITEWETGGLIGGADGIVGAYSVSEFVAPVEMTLQAIPNWVLDTDNGSIAEKYFENAEIPSSYYAIKTPDQLTCCDELFVLPHADPTWASHSVLRDYIINCKGSLWAACHSVSDLENVSNPADITEKMNFLSDTMLVNYSSPGHKSGNTPFAYGHPDHPVMQFMDVLDGATQNGSEQIYLPALGSQWRSSTFIGVWDTMHGNLPGGGDDYLSDGEAAVVAFGHAFGSDTLGYVMYEGGHSHDGSGPEEIAAQRAFFNFAFYATQKRAERTVVTITSPSYYETGVAENISATVTGIKPPYFITWKNTCGGTFGNDTLFSTTFTIPTSYLQATCNLQAVISDSCGGTLFEDMVVNIYQAPIAANDTDSTYSYLPRKFWPLTNDHDENGDDLTLSLIGPTTTPAGGTFTNNGDGTVTYYPLVSYSGTDSIAYEICDESPTPKCDTAFIFVVVSFSSDHDGDGVLDVIDLDDDNDGILDSLENASGIDGSKDTDLDGYPDFVDQDYPGYIDANNDGINDNFDVDMDGIADHLDLDSDNDGIPDAIEANSGTSPPGYNASTARISGAVAANGIPVAVGNGINPNDFDGDGLPDPIDLDSDNDGIVDLVEAGGTDSDGDGTIDGWTDSNDDGLDDATLAAPLAITATDSDAQPDYLDIDSDNDGIVDVIEGHSTAAYAAPSGTDTDGDGIDDAYDSDNGGTPVVLEDFDGDGTPDFRDTDSDNDSKSDATEGSDANADKLPDVDCSAMLDTDNDGLYDCYDTSATANPLGSNAPLQNFDGTPDRDWRDVDDDDDGVLTIIDLDYLNNPCGPAQVLILNQNFLNADSVIQTELQGNTDLSNANPALGAPDLNLTGKKVEVPTDILELRMSDTIPSGANVVIFGENNAVDIRVSLDRITWTTIATDLDLGTNTLADSDTIETTVDFRYIEFKVGISANDALIDAVEAVFYSEHCSSPPDALNDQVKTYVNTSIEIDVQENDTEELNSPLNTSAITSPSNGSIVVVADSTILYTPNVNFSGMDTFTYSVCTDAGLCDTATVYVTVLPIPCPAGKEPGFTKDSIYADSTILCRPNNTVDPSKCDPEILGIPDDVDISADFKFDEPGKHDTIIVRLSKPLISTPSDITLNLFVREWDDDGNFELAVSEDAQSWNIIGQYSKPASTTSVTYNASTFNTYLVSTEISYNFQYVRLRHVGITGEKINFDAIEAVYDSISSCVNPPPAGSNDSVTTAFNTPSNMAVLANDSDPLNDSILTSSIVSNPSNGTVTINANGSITYTPDLGFMGTDTYQYEVCDTGTPIGCDTVLARIVVLQPNGFPLPIDLIHFAVDNLDEGVLAEWVTLQEIDNEYFTLERSKDGSSFVEIARIDGAGTSMDSRHYDHLDRNAYSGLSYYRLKQTNIDGAYSFGPVRSIERSAHLGPALTLYPNVIKNGQSLNYRYPLRGESIMMKLQMSRIDGTIVYSTDLELKALGVIDLSGLNLTTGIYTIICEIHGTRQFFKLFVTE